MLLQFNLVESSLIEASFQMERNQVLERDPLTVRNQALETAGTMAAQSFRHEVASCLNGPWLMPRNLGSLLLPKDEEGVFWG